MFKIKSFIIIIICMATFTSCSAGFTDSSDEVQQIVTSYIQTPEQLYPDIEAHISNKQTGIWLPYMHFEDYMYGRTADEYRQAVGHMLDEYTEKDGINTVYFHVHPCGDAYYRSEIFPTGTYLDGDYDPLEIMLEEAHSRGIAVHAWLNPLRCQTAEQMAELPDTFIVKQWAEDDDCHYAELLNGRWYLNPAYDDVVELISQCADEILNNYSVDGIHIDDYFYPTTDIEFDRSAFEASGQTDLAEWRTENCTRFVNSLYDTVKAHGNDILFGISPQGNINADYSTQYADVRLWGGTSGYCDYIVPQIYFGFKNAVCPFEQTLQEWENITAESDVSLIIGLAAYKLGREDKWAGEAGETEWIDDSDIIEKQIAIVESSSADGYALYY